MKILDRYVIAELMSPLLLGAATFTLLFMSMDHLFRVAQMIVDGTPVMKAMGFLVDSLPSILVLTFPMAVLLACLLAFGRLSSDSEIVAIKAGGVGFLRIALPGILLTLVISVCSYVLNETIVPDATYRAHNLILNDVLRDSHDNVTLRDSFPDGSERRMFARKLDEVKGIMYDMTMQNYNAEGRTREIYAKTVHWEKDTGRWTMHDVNTYDYNPDQSVHFESDSKSAFLAVAQTPHELAQRDRLPEEMSRQDLKQKIEVIESADHGQKDPQYNRFVLMYHEKLAIPFTCFVFGLLGMPLGVRPQRTSPSIGLGISLVFILFYYVLMTLAHALGENSILPAAIAAWVPNVVFGCLGVYLVIRAGRT